MILKQAETQRLSWPRYGYSQFSRQKSGHVAIWKADKTLVFGCRSKECVIIQRGGDLSTFMDVSIMH